MLGEFVQCVQATVYLYSPYCIIGLKTTVSLLVHVVYAMLYLVIASLTVICPNIYMQLDNLTSAIQRFKCVNVIELYSG